MKIKVGDQVLVIAGKDKGKSGKVIGTIRKDHKVIVEGINIHKKHQKPTNTNDKGSIVEIAAPIDVSNVKKIDAKATKKETKKEEKVVEKKASAKKTTKKETK